MAKAIRVGFVYPIIPLSGADMVLVQGSRLNPGNKAFPDARLATGLQWMAVRAPAIKISHHAYLGRIRGPDSKIRPTGCIDSQRMRPELFIETGVRALVEVVQISMAQERDPGGD
jgi:hypothetical protein